MAKGPRCTNTSSQPCVEEALRILSVILVIRLIAFSLSLYGSCVNYCPLECNF